MCVCVGWVVEGDAESRTKITLMLICEISDAFAFEVAGCPGFPFLILSPSKS